MSRTTFHHHYLGLIPPVIDLFWSWLEPFWAEPSTKQTRTASCLAPEIPHWSFSYFTAWISLFWWFLTEWFYWHRAYQYKLKSLCGGGFILFKWMLCLYYMATLAEKHGWMNHCTSCWGQTFCLEMNFIQTWKARLEWFLCNNINNVWSAITSFVQRYTFPSSWKMYSFFFSKWSYLGFLGDSDPNSCYNWNLKVNFVTFIPLK